jgi:acyl carrier protein
MEDTYQRLVELLVGKFEVRAEQVAPQATLTDLDLDSLAVVELFVVVQERWGAPLEESEAVGSLTVRETAQLIDRRLAGTDDDVAADADGAR